MLSLMFYSLEGNVRRLFPPHVCIDVSGVGYLAAVPLPVFDALEDGKNAKLFIHTHVREDRFDLFGFLTEEDRRLFMEVIGLSGIGPKLGLEICSVPKRTLHQAIASSDAGLLSDIKGVGKKRAEKLLLDLQSLFEREPIVVDESDAGKGKLDEDALLALLSLGYERNTIMKMLRDLPENMKSTEDRVTAVLRSL